MNDSMIMDCKHDDLLSRPSITPDSDITEELLHLHHSFGYDSGRRSNLQLLEERTLVFIAGNHLVFIDIHTNEQRYLRSCSGQGIGSIAVHTSSKCFAVGEKGTKPNIIVYEHPSLKPFHILRGGAERAYSCLNFNHDGSLLASVSSSPDFMLTLWNWGQEEVMLSCKVMSPEVYRISFSPHNPGLLTSAGSGHIKFWKMASTFTGLKLQGLMGHFGKRAATDIEGYVELPDGKVVSGSDRGNMLLWEGTGIKVEICRKDGRPCHEGTVQPFSLEDGQLLTFGSDGVIRSWDLESIDSAEADSDWVELEPMDEMMVGYNVSLSWMVKSPVPGSFVWFAQDSRGAIWKLDLSFTYTTPDPECLFSFHAGAIQALHVSSHSHLMTTTTLDRSVKVFDFLAKRELAQISFNQGGTALCWAPRLGNQHGALLLTGFEDGVIRLLELLRDEYGSGRSKGLDAKLHLRQAFKPHDAPVTAVAYERNGATVATGSSDCTVFFFTVGETYRPIGFIHVPGPVQGLEWSPLSHTENRLLILCQNGYVAEVHCPKLEHQSQTKTFLLAELPRRSFRFKSIKHQMKTVEEPRLMGEGEKCGKKEEFLDPLPDASLLYCGFYSEPGHIWLSMGGDDAGSLYHCKFPENLEEETEQWQAPFDLRRLHNNDPILSITFSSTRHLMFCGLRSGSIRVYKLQPNDPCLTSLHACWELSVHDNHHGCLKHICCSYDDHFLLTAGDDGNIFSFSLRSAEELQKGLRMVKLPGRRVSHEKDDLAQDIDDPAANSMEAAMQMLEKEHVHQEASVRLAEKLKRLGELQRAYQHLVKENQSLPEHIRLTPMELMLDQRFSEQTEREKTEKVKAVQNQLAWEEERSRRGLHKLQEWFKESLNSNLVTVAAITSSHLVTTYSLQEPIDPPGSRPPHGRAEQLGADAAAAVDSFPSEDRLSREASQLDAEVPVQMPVPPPSTMKLADRQMERLRKAAEKAERARAKIEKRRQEWEQLYAERPKENHEDPQDVQAICEAKETIGDFKLKSAKDFTVPKHLRMTLERKRAEKRSLEEKWNPTAGMLRQMLKLREKQVEMNRRIWALRDSKARLVSELHEKSNQLQRVHKLLPSHLHRLSPSIPRLLPEEEGGSTLTEHRNIFPAVEKDRLLGFLERIEEEEQGMSLTAEDQEGSFNAELSQLEEELLKGAEIKLLYLQDSLIEQMERSVSQFDAQLVLRQQKLLLDWELKLADMHQLTLYQELLVLQEVNQREELLQERLLARLEEQNGVTSKLEERNKQLDARRRDVAKLQGRDKSLAAAFRASLGEDNKFEEFLTKVFQKKVKRAKPKEHAEGERTEISSHLRRSSVKDASAGEDNTCDQSGEEDDWDEDDEDEDYFSNTEERGSSLDDSVCPSGCDPQLFDSTLKLRNHRLDLEEQLAEEKKNVDTLVKECDALMKKKKSAEASRKAAEDDLEKINQEKHLRSNALDVVVPLRLRQIEFVVDGALPGDLSLALVLPRTELKRLQERIAQLHSEKIQQREVYTQAHQQHFKLIQECKDMDAEIQVLEKQCNQLMMMKFGRQVDLEALQTLSGNRTLEELKQEKLFQESQNDKDMKGWEAKVEEARQSLAEVTRYNTERLLRLKSLLDEKNALEQKLKTQLRHII
ncbi:cilia- and flagella-associated protein 44 [Synchiropus splendidus]|uniref:cilia- and flagella-associated protein 44 n=1 Tax=Synchiropus splendidus TaxID=270530 RepID=UPI00237DA279|nr:cilia- and flagella-associated protein 44 [Synchiropus splendidus]